MNDKLIYEMIKTLGRYTHEQARVCEYLLDNLEGMDSARVMEVHSSLSRCAIILTQITTDHIANSR